jgi:hypothetical protein
MSTQEELNQPDLVFPTAGETILRVLRSDRSFSTTVRSLASLAGVAVVLAGSAVPAWTGADGKPGPGDTCTTQFN